MEDSLDLLQHQIKQQKKKAIHLGANLESINQTSEQQHKNATQSAHNNIDNKANHHQVHKQKQLMDSLQIHQKKKEQVNHTINHTENQHKTNIMKNNQIQNKQQQHIKISIPRSDQHGMSSSLLSADMEHLNKTPFFGNQHLSAKQLPTQQVKNKKDSQKQINHKKQQKIVHQAQQVNEFINYTKNQHIQKIPHQKQKTQQSHLVNEHKPNKQVHHEQIKHIQKQEKPKTNNNHSPIQIKQKQEQHKKIQSKQIHKKIQEVDKIPTKQQKQIKKNAQPKVGFNDLFEIIYKKASDARLQLIYNLSQINLNNHHQQQKNSQIHNQNKKQTQKNKQQTKQHHANKNEKQIINQHQIQKQKHKQQKHDGQPIKNIQNSETKVQKISKIIQKKSEDIQHTSDIKNSKPLTPLKQPSESSNDRKHEKTNSGVQQRMSSAQSQRIKSALSRKSSQGMNDQSFRLDLTAKSKNFRQLNKMDSLLYSAQSGFGYNPSSPRKQNRMNEHASSNKTVLKMDQIADLQQEDKFKEDQHKNSSRLIHKSYSQKVEFEKQNKNYNRIMSSKQKIQQYHEHQADDHQNNAHNKPNFQNTPNQYKQYKEDEQQNYKYNDGNGQQMQNFFKSHPDSDQKQKQYKNHKNNHHQHDKHQYHQNKHHIQSKQQKQQDSMYNQFQIQGPSTLNYDDYQFKEPSSNLQIQSHKKINDNQKQHSNQQNDEIFQIKNGKLQKVQKHKSPSKMKQKQKLIDKYQKIMSVPIKQKYRNSEDYKNQHSSAVDGTLIDKVQNFDADDQEGEQFQKQMTQSAHLAKKGSQKVISRKRVGTQIGPLLNQKQKKFSKRSGPKFNLIDLEQQQSHNNSRAVSIKSHKSHQGSNTNIFSTEISTYQNKIAKIKQEKQLRKKRLQQQLAKVNQQIKILNKKEQQMSPNSKNNYISRVQISDNNQAQKKAQSLVKNLRSQKRNRNMAKLGQFKNLDKNINEYMEQLSKLRQQNEQKIKQKKKIQILQRMKQNQMRKLNDKKKIQQNQQFVIHLKSPGQSNKFSQIQDKQENQKRNSQQMNFELDQQNQNQLGHSDLKQLTPSLNQKKAQLKKVRGLSVKKNQDKYQQLLS